MKGVSKKDTESLGRLRFFGEGDDSSSSDELPDDLFIYEHSLLRYSLGRSTQQASHAICLFDVGNRLDFKDAMFQARFLLHSRGLKRVHALGVTTEDEGKRGREVGYEEALEDSRRAGLQYSEVNTQTGLNVDEFLSGIAEEF